MDYRQEERKAKEAIIDGCVSILNNGVQWYDTEWLVNCESLAFEIKFLRSRGLLFHHPLIHKLVHFKE